MDVEWKDVSFCIRRNAEMAELVDAPASKAGIRKDVWVRVPLSVQMPWLSGKEPSLIRMVK